MSDLLALFWELPTEPPIQNRNASAWGEILDVSSPMGGHSGLAGLTAGSEGMPDHVLETPPTPVIPAIPVGKSAVATQKGSLHRQPYWQWVPESPVTVDAQQYSLTKITLQDRQLATQLSDSWARPQASLAGAGLIESLLIKIAACRLLDIDPTSQPFAMTINTWCQDIVFHGATIYLVATPRRDKFATIRTYAACLWEFALVSVIYDGKVRLAGYLSSAEIMTINKRNEGSRGSRTIRISYDALKPWEWLEHELTAQIRRRQPGDHNLRSFI